MNFRPKVNTEAIFDMRYDQVHEASELFGFKVYYLQASDVDTNVIFSEIERKEFTKNKAFPMFAIRDNDTMFQGTESFGGFGYVPSYHDIKYIPKKWFDVINITPIEGDLIFDTETSMMMEVSKVDENIDEFSGNKIGQRVFTHKIFLKTYDTSTESTVDDTMELTDIDNALASIGGISNVKEETNHRIKDDIDANTDYSTMNDELTPDDNPFGFLN